MQTDGDLIIGTEIDTKSFDAQIEELEDKLDTLAQEYEAALKDTEFPEDELKKYQSEIEKTKNKIIDLKKKQESLAKSSLIQMSSMINNISKSMSRIVSSVTKWGLALFGIRGAYSLIRQAMSTISQEDEQIATDIKYMQWILAQTLKPVVEWIINALYLVITLINNISVALFNYNILAGKSADDFKAMKKNTGGIAKDLANAKKQLAGFDEMNILQDTSSSGTSGGGGSALDKWTPPDMSEYVKFIRDHLKEIAGILGSIALIFASIKIVNFFNTIKKLFPFLKNISALKLGGVLAGIAIALVGIIETIDSLIKYFNDPTWNNFSKVLDGISKAIIGVGVALVALNVSNPVGWMVIAAGIAVKYVKELLNMIDVLKNGKAEILSNKEAQEKLNEARQKAINMENEYTYAIDRLEESQRNLTETENRLQMSGEELYKSVRDGTLDYKNMNTEQRELYKAYLDNKSAQEQVKIATKNLTQAQKEEKEMSWEAKLAKADETKEYDKFKEAVISAYKEGGLKADEARDLIERAMSKIDSKTDEVFTKNLPKKIKEGLNPNHYRSNAMDLVTTIGGILAGIISGSAATGLITLTVGKKLKELFGFAKGGIVVPKLASGGIINRPGHGVPLGNAVGGERGMEGVIPLTDSQQMMLLGEAIGKYITINANITNNMNGKVISRELQRVKSEEDFAFNR